MKQVHDTRLILNKENTEAKAEIIKKWICLFNLSSIEVNGKIVSHRFAFPWDPFIFLW